MLAGTARIGQGRHIHSQFYSAMTTPIQNDDARSILAGEKRKAHAKAVLNRAYSAVPSVLLTMLIIGIAGFLQGAYQFQAPMWVNVFLVVGVTMSAANTMELMTLRRRLDAVVILLQQQQDSEH